MSENATIATSKCKVLIIGAGMAGLSAANHLVKNGFNDFKILEARSRIGGRIISIEMGQQKVHTFDQNIEKQQTTYIFPMIYVFIIM